MLDERDVNGIVAIVVVYGLLELVSLALLCRLISSKLGFSAAKQLAFLLEKGQDTVQCKLVFWVLYVSQMSLVHFGMWLTPKAL